MPMDGGGLSSSSISSTLIIFGLNTTLFNRVFFRRGGGRGASNFPDFDALRYVVDIGKNSPNPKFF